MDKKVQIKNTADDIAGKIANIQRKGSDKCPYEAKDKKRMKEAREPKETLEFKSSSCIF